MERLKGARRPPQLLVGVHDIDSAVDADKNERTISLQNSEVTELPVGRLEGVNVARPAVKDRAVLVDPLAFDVDVLLASARVDPVELSVRRVTGLLDWRVAECQLVFLASTHDSNVRPL